MDKVYNKSFYDNNCGISYDKAEIWTNLFENIAKNIVERFSPKTVLDAGCAYGYLVKALRNLGVDAYGIDISEHAISKADKDIQPFVAVHSITEELPSDFPKKFDLVITIEVLEHISPEDGKQAIKLLCSYANTIIFTSSPDDIVDRFHLNVQQAEYWAKEFARNYFYRDLIQSAEYICPWAMIFRKGDSFEDVVFNYELNRRIDIALQKKGKPGSGKIYFKCSTWSEENSYSFTYEGSSIDTGKISIPAGCLEIRFDPVKETVCAVISDIMIGSNAGSLPITMGNYDRVINGIYFFPISDPQFNIFLPEGTSWIEIKCTVTLLDGLTEQKIISGLGRDLAEASSEAMDFWKQAERISGLPLREIFWEGDESAMSDTRALQPALTVVNCNLWRAFSERFGASLAPFAAAGHSLGEFSALAAAGVLSPRSVLEITSLRGRLMAEADPEGRGAMAAIVKLDMDAVAAIVEEAAAESGALLVAANRNTPQQTVVSGAREAVALAVQKAKERKGRGVELKVSGAFHSPMMAEANRELAPLLEKTVWNAPRFPVYCNVDGRPVHDGESAKKSLLRQMVTPVFWVDLLRNLYLAGVRWWLEISPKAVLGKMVGPSLAAIAAQSDHLRVDLVDSLSGILNYAM